MNAVQIGAYAFFGSATVAAFCMLAALSRRVHDIDGTAESVLQATRRAREASAVFGVWMISVGLVIATMQDWPGALPLFVMGPVYIAVGQLVWRRYDRERDTR